ncbi:MAG: hypothetical protein IIC02_02710 [Planctomycetes bacterium]|nr:hypothetical protein [Planctomycetota bacterium]
MQTKNSASVLTVLLALCGVVDARQPDFTIQFDYHEATGVPGSDIEFQVTMGLMKEVQDGDNIGWNVQVVTIRELNGFGEVVETWFTTSPTVNTADNRWWIDHDDPNNPVNSEFLIPPLIYGTAGHVNPTEAALEFAIEGAVYVAPPGGPPYDNTASLTTLLQEEGNPTPKKDEEDEPVEMPNIPSEPFPS